MAKGYLKNGLSNEAKNGLSLIVLAFTVLVVRASRSCKMLPSMTIPLSLMKSSPKIQFDLKLGTTKKFCSILSARSGKDNKIRKYPIISKSLFDSTF